MNKLPEKKLSIQNSACDDTPRNFDVLYTCDPEKNTACSKRMCFLNDGPCKATRDLTFAKQPVEKVKLLFQMSQEEADELKKVDEPDE